MKSDDRFKKRYIDAIEATSGLPRRRELSRLIAPFTLRRMKSSVLHELPEKIEDLRFCHLSDDQIKLYRDAVDSRKQGIMERPSQSGAAVPYIHIFALLTLLKQICDHPSLVDGDVDNYQQFESGKWDLFTELMAESMDSGQNVVVYSQFAAMIDIISAYLKTTGIDHAVLTGKSP